MFDDEGGGSFGSDTTGQYGGLSWGGYDPSGGFSGFKEESSGGPRELTLADMLSNAMQGISPFDPPPQTEAPSIPGINLDFSSGPPKFGDFAGDVGKSIREALSQSYMGSVKRGEQWGYSEQDLTKPESWMGKATRGRGDQRGRGAAMPYEFPGLETWGMNAPGVTNPETLFPGGMSLSDWVGFFGHRI